jgi:hypothetical protein
MTFNPMSSSMPVVRRWLLVVAATSVLVACQSNQSRLNMVTAPGTGLQYGSAIEKSIFVDADQFENNAIKVSIRNTSGDPAFDVHGFRSNLERSYADKGFKPTRSDFGIKLDLNVVYSGHIREDMSAQYGFLGAAAGGIAGYRSSTRAGTATGVLAGATIGAIIGGTQTRDTYITISEVAIGFAESKGVGQTSKSVTFGSSPKLQEERKSGFKPFRGVLRTRVAVYGGGRNVSQQQIAEEVKRRLIRIVADMI